MLIATMQRILKLSVLSFWLVLNACQDGTQKADDALRADTDVVEAGDNPELDSKHVHIKAEPPWVETSDLLPVPENPTGLIFVRRNDVLVHLDEKGQYNHNSQRMKLLDSRALEAGNVALTWNPEAGAPIVHRLLIHRNDEVINVLDNNEFEVLRREGQLEQAMLDGYLTAVLRVPDLRVGDELEWAFTIPSQDTTLGNRSSGLMSLAAAFQAGRHKMGISWEDGQEPTIKLTKDLEGLERRTPRSLSVTLDSPEILQALKDAPPRYNWRRVMEYSDFKSWELVSKDFNDLFEDASQLSRGSEIKDEAKRIAKTYASDAERMKAALELVQQQVRYIYVGLNGGNYKPAAATETWSRRYGDCKGKSALLFALLKELDIEAELVLVNNSGADDGFDQRLPSPALFDHVVLRTAIDGEKYWLDPTLPVVIEPNAKPLISYLWVLPLSEQGSSLEAVPQGAYELPQEMGLTEYDARAGFDAPARKVRTTVTRGVAGLSEYLSYSAVTSEQLKTKMSNAFIGTKGWDDIEDVTYRYDRPTQASILSITGTGPVDWDDEGNGSYDLTLPGGGFRPPSRRLRANGEGPDLPFYKRLSYGCDVTTVRLPKDTKLANWGFNSTFTTEIFGRIYYRMMERRDDHTIRMVRASRNEHTEILPQRAQRDNKRISSFDNSKARIEYVPNKVMITWGANKPVPATYEIDWTGAKPPCLPEGVEHEPRTGTSNFNGKTSKSSPGNYQGSLENEASNGDADAQFRLAQSLRYKNDGRTTDQSLDWLKQAAAQDHKKAILELARYYIYQEEDPKKAEAYLKLSENNKEGAALLAGIYFRNPDVFPDISEAKIMELYHISAENDDRNGQRELAQRYKDGSIVKRDEVESLKWILISHGFKSSYSNEFRESLPETDRTKAERQAEDWIKKNRPESDK